jgi:hypothetical protein
MRSIFKHLSYFVGNLGMVKGETCGFGVSKKFRLEGIAFGIRHILNVTGAAMMKRGDNPNKISREQ